jgi:hypothetical protein
VSSLRGTRDHTATFAGSTHQLIREYPPTHPRVPTTSPESTHYVATKLAADVPQYVANIAKCRANIAKYRANVGDHPPCYPRPLTMRSATSHTAVTRWSPARETRVRHSCESIDATGRDPNSRHQLDIDLPAGAARRRVPSADNRCPLAEDALLARAALPPRIHPHHPYRSSIWRRTSTSWRSCGRSAASFERMMSCSEATSSVAPKTSNRTAERTRSS